MKLSEKQMTMASRPLALLLRVVGSTWRVRKQGFPSETIDSRYIDAIYHGQMLCYLSIYRFQPCVTMISEHRDGQIMAKVVERFGGSVVRGSTTRGGVRAYLNMLKNYKDLGWIVTPDGPRGPRGVVQEGVIKMASDSGKAIRPHGYAIAGAKRLRTWDQFTIPYPFARIVECVGEPISVPPKISKAERAERAAELSRRLADLIAEAETALAAWSRRPSGQVTGQGQSAPPSI